MIKMTATYTDKNNIHRVENFFLNAKFPHFKDLIFRSHQDADDAFDILYKEAINNNGFLSYNRFMELVYGQITECDPTYGWSLEALKRCKYEPYRRLHILRVPCPDRY